MGAIWRVVEGQKETECRKKQAVSGTARAKFHYGDYLTLPLPSYGYRFFQVRLSRDHPWMCWDGPRAIHTLKHHARSPFQGFDKE